MRYLWVTNILILIHQLVEIQHRTFCTTSTHLLRTEMSNLSLLDFSGWSFSFFSLLSATAFKCYKTSLKNIFLSALLDIYEQVRLTVFNLWLQTKPFNDIQCFTCDQEEAWRGKKENLISFSLWHRPEAHLKVFSTCLWEAQPSSVHMFRSCHFLKSQRSERVTNGGSEVFISSNHWFQFHNNNHEATPPTFD